MELDLEFWNEFLLWIGEERVLILANDEGMK